MGSDDHDLSILPRIRRAFAAIEPYTRPIPLLVIISGPSGVGKDSVIQRMREQYARFHFVVTATDRAPRPGEVDGVDYHFVSTVRFEEMIARDELYEHAFVYGQYKGVPKAEVCQALASGQDVLMRLDIQGTATVRQLAPQALTIFLLPPSPEALLNRLKQRAADSAEQIEHRLQMALSEMKSVTSFDYAVVNEEGQLAQTVERIMAIIAAEKCRTARRQNAL